MSNSRYPLRQIILDDLTSRNKVALVLLAAIIIMSLSTIWITHQTRLKVAEAGKLIDANEKLGYQYTNLNLEETSLTNRSRIEAVAERFGLQPINKDQEIILIEPK